MAETEKVIATVAVTMANGVPVCAQRPGENPEGAIASAVEELAVAMQERAGLLSRSCCADGSPLNCVTAEVVLEIGKKTFRSNRPAEKPEEAITLAKADVLAGDLKDFWTKVPEKV